MKTMPQIQKVMTPFPHTLGFDMTLDKAQEMMRTHHIRHLPVQKAGRLIGILSDRDVKLGLSFSEKSQLTAEEVMSPEPYTVAPHSPLDQVVTEMAEKKLGCAIVVGDGQKVVGIFTATDGLRVLAEVLQTNYSTQRL